MIVASFLHDWFGFPNGSVLTNLVASAICVAVGAWRIVKWLKKVHRSHERLHEHVAELHTHVLDLHRHHGVETTPRKESPK